MSAAITINDVYPWGRTLDEYRRMFDLGDRELGGRIFGCADGPASFNAELTALGGRVVSCDPLYRFSGDEIRRRVEVTCDHLLGLVRENYARFVWDRIRSPEDLGILRMGAMDLFLKDYKAGRESGRYLDRSVPELGFHSNSFDLALCSHFLFLYSEQFDLAFHLAAVRELSRIAGDVRVFPLLDMKGKRSVHVAPLMEELQAEGFFAEIVPVGYEFQRGGNEMLRIRREGTR